MKKTLFAQH